MKRSTPHASASATTSSAQSARLKRAPTLIPCPWPRWSMARTRKWRPSGAKDGNQLRSAVAPKPWSSMRVGAPGGPATSRTKVRPRPGRSTWRPGGRGIGGANDASDVDSDDLHLQHAAGRLVLDHVAHLAAHERGSERRARRDHRQVLAPLLDRADEIAL